MQLSFLHSIIHLYIYLSIHLFYLFIRSFIYSFIYCVQCVTHALTIISSRRRRSQGQLKLPLFDSISAISLIWFANSDLSLYCLQCVRANMHHFRIDNRKKSVIIGRTCSLSSFAFSAFFNFTANSWTSLSNPWSVHRRTRNFKPAKNHYILSWIYWRRKIITHSIDKLIKGVKNAS